MLFIYSFIFVTGTGMQTWRHKRLYLLVILFHCDLEGKSEDDNETPVRDHSNENY